MLLIFVYNSFMEIFIYASYINFLSYNKNFRFYCYIFNIVMHKIIFIHLNKNLSSPLLKKGKCAPLSFFRV